MKYRYFIILLCLAFIATDTYALCSNTCNISTHTTLIPRTMAQNSVLELGLNNYFEYYTKDCGDCAHWFSVEFTAPYFFKSVQSSKVAQYFLPTNCCDACSCGGCISVGQNNTSTVSSPWLELISGSLTDPFLSNICMRPTREVIGGAVRLFFDFNDFCADSCFGSGWWLSIFVPVQQVKHTLHLEEFPLPRSAPGTFDGIINAIQAFNNPNWNFGKWSTTTLKKSGIDDISIKLGNTFHVSCGHADLYGLLFVPTGKGTKALNLFEPLVGSNHVGIGAGLNADLISYQYDDTKVDLMIDFRYAYFLKHTEVRSFDLFNGDLSRYLLVVQPDSTNQALPGINFFTKEVEVTPRSMFEFWTGLHFSHCNFHVEIGYDFWLRSKEKIRLVDQDLGVGILDIIAAAQVGQCPITAHCARICQSVPGVDAPISDIEFISVNNSNAINEQGVIRDGNQCCTTFCASPNQCSFLNLDSAANPRAVSSTVYGALAYESCWCTHPIMVGVGMQYEFAHRISALSQYGVWLKTAISF